MHRRALMGTLAGSALAATAGSGAETSSDEQRWETILAERLPLYGHRNWIVVADSAYPAQSRAGIETIVSGEDYLRVLEITLRHISASRHVRPIIYQDEELRYVAETDAPGVGEIRRRLGPILGNSNVSVLPHEQIIHKLDQTAQVFDVLIIKTTLTIPYTSVFFQLDCAYWPADAEKGLRQEMAAHRHG